MFNVISKREAFLSQFDTMLSQGGFPPYRVSYMRARTWPTFFTFVSQPLHSKPSINTAEYMKEYLNAFSSYIISYPIPSLL